MNQEKEKEKKPLLLSSKELKKLLAEDNLQGVIIALDVINTEYKSPSFSDKLTMLSARWESWQKQFHDGSADYDELNVSKIQIRQALLALINNLPKGGQEPAAAKPKGILESRFKKQLFWTMIMAKLSVIAFIWFHQSTGGFSKDEAIASITLLLPVFTAYVAAMVNDYLSDKYVDTLLIFNEKYLKPGLQRMAYSLIPLYIILLLVIIHLKAKGIIAYDEMNPLLALVESGFGVYVGKIIFTVFGRKG